MKTVRFFVVTILAVLLHAGCKDEIDDNNKLPDNPLGVVNFTSSLGEQLWSSTTLRTRASDATWNRDDAIGIYMVDTAGLHVVNNYANKQYLHEPPVENNLFKPAGLEDMYYPSSGSVKFIAYYPYDPVISTDTIGVYRMDLRRAELGFLENEDLLWTKTTAVYDKNSTAPVDLVFEHQLSKLNLNIRGEGIADSLLLKHMSILIRNLYTGATFNLKSKTLTITSERDTVYPVKLTPDSTSRADTVKYGAVLVPQQSSELDSCLTIEFRFDTEISEKYVFRDEVQRTFRQGKEYTYNLIIARSGLVYAPITDWGNGGSKNDSTAVIRP
jgi:hypothetical protein